MECLHHGNGQLVDLMQGRQPRAEAHAINQVNWPLNVVVDIGANVGFVGLWAVEKKQAKHVLCIEPESRSFEFLVKNVQDNAVTTKISCVRAAVWNEPGTLYIKQAGTGGHAHLHPEFVRHCSHCQKENVVTEEVPAIPFVQILKLYDTIDYLKIDVDGSEFGFMLPTPDVVQALSDNVKFIDLETHDQFFGEHCIDVAYSMDEYWATLRVAGFVKAPARFNGIPDERTCFVNKRCKEIVGY